jgi:hypothetical protein
MTSLGRAARLPVGVGAGDPPVHDDAARANAAQTSTGRKNEGAVTVVAG